MHLKPRLPPGFISNARRVAGRCRRTRFQPFDHLRSSQTFNNQPFDSSVLPKAAKSAPSMGSFTGILPERSRFSRGELLLTAALALAQDLGSTLRGSAQALPVVPAVTSAFLRPGLK